MQKCKYVFTSGQKNTRQNEIQNTRIIKNTYHYKSNTVRVFRIQKFSYDYISNTYAIRYIALISQYKKFNIVGIITCQYSFIMSWTFCDMFRNQIMIYHSPSVILVSILTFDILSEYLFPIQTIVYQILKEHETNKSSSLGDSYWLTVHHRSLITSIYRYYYTWKNSLIFFSRKFSCWQL